MELILTKTDESLSFELHYFPKSYSSKKGVRFPKYFQRRKFRQKDYFNFTFILLSASHFDTCNFAAAKLSPKNSKRRANRLTFLGKMLCRFWGPALLCVRLFVLKSVLSMGPFYFWIFWTVLGQFAGIGTILFSEASII